MTADKLPTWRLQDLYVGPRDKAVEEDFVQATQQAAQFAALYENKLHQLDGEGLAKAIQTFESVEEIIYKLSTYSFLLFAEDMGKQENIQFYQQVKERVNDIISQILFFTLEINDLSDETLQKMLSSSNNLKKYAPWIRDTRSFKPYQCSKEIEKLFHEKTVSSRSNWIRLFEEVFSSLRFQYRGEELAPSAIMDLMSHKDEMVRKDAAQAFAAGLKSEINIFALITNTLAKDKQVEDNWRGFKRPITSRNVSNLVEDEVVDLLIKTVVDAYPKLSHRYFQLKAKWLGKEKLAYWDRNAPLPDVPDTSIPWKRAEDIVLTAYKSFSPEMGEVASLFFKNNWIDAVLRPSKDSGAFSHPCVPSVHPYILLNYHGKLRDVMTLAHEVGHGIHQYLARSQGLLLADTPLTIAETASVFGEMLTFQSLLRDAKDAQTRRYLLASKIEDMLNTVVRQIAFCRFEEKLHTQRRKGELSVKDLGQTWMKTQKESLGPAFDIDEKEYQNFWSYIPHFIHTPFYVYAYAFGDCLVNSLYMTYEEGFPHFQENYLDLLKAGGSKRYDELLAIFGLTPKSPAFWQKGLSLIEKFIHQLEAEM